MSVNICPTITAFDEAEYQRQMDVVKAFAGRVHIDLMDGEFAPTKSPELDKVWLLDNAVNDIHLMYMRPMEQLEGLFRLNPSLVVIHYESYVDHVEFAEKLKSRNIRAGLAVLSNTEIDDALEPLKHFDHVLIFSGKLGYHGGEAEMRLIDKVERVRKELPYIEIGWDGGVNDTNAQRLVEAGVNVLNVGGYIQDSLDPAGSYAKLTNLLGSAG